MLGFHLSYRWLRWSAPTDPPAPLPTGVTRTFVKTPSGDIEVLSALPQGTNPKTKKNTTPLFFVHGGMGSAGVWLEYMQFLAQHGVPCYAVSLRGHGNSWHPSYLKMVFATPRARLVEDVIAGVRFAEKDAGGEEVVLVGHSSGGGLVQDVLAKGLARAKGLVLAAAVPGSGSTGVYMNWWRLDPWFTIRMIFHGWHPNSPLSHPVLTRRVFFSDKVSDAHVEAFQRRTNAYESYLWPFSMMRPFVDPRALLGNIDGWTAGTGGQRIMVLHGGGDRIMTLPIMRRLAHWYRETVAKLVGEKKLDVVVDETRKLDGPGGLDTVGSGVRFCSVPIAGHHLQNDAMWEVGAQKLLEFWEQL